MDKLDLTKLRINNDYNKDNNMLDKHNMYTSENISVYFQGQIDVILDLIAASDLVIGCVAWLTNKQILEALAEKQTSIIVQKEDFLRPDFLARKDIKKLYTALKCDVLQSSVPNRVYSYEDVIFNYFFTDKSGDFVFRGLFIKNKKYPSGYRLIRDYSYDEGNDNLIIESDPRFPEWIGLTDLTELYDEQSYITFMEASADELSEFEPIRCVGIKRTGKAQAMPLMHHKFLVFLRRGDYVQDDYDPFKSKEPDSKPRWVENEYLPFAVWTGSMNLTYNATLSRENGILIRDKDIAQAYLNEFWALYPFSEPLNWTTEWMPRMDIDSGT